MKNLIFSLSTGLLIAFILITTNDKSIESTKNQVSNTSEDYNCEDFKNWEEAQEVYEYYGGAKNDIHHLNRDKHVKAYKLYGNSLIKKKALHHVGPLKH